MLSVRPRPESSFAPRTPICRFFGFREEGKFLPHIACVPRKRQKAFSRGQKPRFLPAHPNLPQTCGFRKKSECGDFDNKRAFHHRRREKNAAKPTAASAHGGCLWSSSESQQLFCEIRAKAIHAQAKPRLCVAHPDLPILRLQGRGKIFAAQCVRAPKKAKIREKPAIAASVRRCLPELTAFRRRQLAEKRVNIYIFV